MHEFSVVRTLLAQINDIARRNTAVVSEVRVSIGEFSGVDADLLQSAFEQLARESSAEHARLKIERTKLQALRSVRCGFSGVRIPVCLPALPGK